MCKTSDLTYVNQLKRAVFHTYNAKTPQKLQVIILVILFKLVEDVE